MNRTRPHWSKVSAVSLALAVASVGAGGVALAERTQTSPATVASVGTAWGATGSGSVATGPGPRRWNGDGSSDTGSGATTADTSDATTAQDTGMVEVTSTLTDGTAAGTGMVLTSSGTIVTNHHVVEGATSIKVTVVSTGKTYSARYVGASSTKDVAVLRLVGASGLTTVDLSTTATAKGASVVSVGDAGGDGGDLTAARGTVEATGQAINVQDDDGTTKHLTGLVEVSADLVPGDSGGALLNASGDVVGMNVAASSGTANVTGYAIPIATVLSVVDQIESGDATSAISVGYDAFLGVGFSANAAGSDAPTIAGVVSGSPAAGTSLSAGDTVTAVGSTPVSTITQLRKALGALAPGDRVSVSWTTASGAHHTATVTLSRAPIA